MEYRDVPIERAGLNPVKDFLTICRLLGLFRKIKPDIFFGYTVKPVIYGSLAAILADVPRIYSMITGLGYTFMESSSYRQTIAGLVARVLYKLSLRYSERVFFQNPDDLALFVGRHPVRKEQACLVDGSGLDLDYYQVALLSTVPVFLLKARLLADKGVREYVSAARMVLSRPSASGRMSHSNSLSHRSSEHPSPRFRLVGALDPNPRSISQHELASWVEAMACGLPVVSDMPGIREIVGQGQKSGFLVDPLDPVCIAEKLRYLILFPKLRADMGAHNRFEVV